jgi:hypothetical protein
MGRKKSSDPPADQPEDGAGTTATASPGDNGDSRRPAMSWALNSDRTTRIEVAAWLNTHRTQSGEEFEQVSFTMTRSYRDESGAWHKTTSFRTHDKPILDHLLDEYEAWALRRRMTVKADGEDVPF